MNNEKITATPNGSENTGGSDWNMEDTNLGNTENNSDMASVESGENNDIVMIDGVPYKRVVLPPEDPNVVRKRDGVDPEGPRTNSSAEVVDTDMASDLGRQHPAA